MRLAEKKPLVPTTDYQEFLSDYEDTLDRIIKALNSKGWIVYKGEYNPEAGTAELDVKDYGFHNKKISGVTIVVGEYGMFDPPKHWVGSGKVAGAYVNLPGAQGKVVSATVEALTKVADAIAATYGASKSYTTLDKDKPIGEPTKTVSPGNPVPIPHAGVSYMRWVVYAWPSCRLEGHEDTYEDGSSAFYVWFPLMKYAYDADFTDMLVWLSNHYTVASVAGVPVGDPKEKVLDNLEKNDVITSYWAGKSLTMAKFLGRKPNESVQESLVDEEAVLEKKPLVPTSDYQEFLGGGEGKLSYAEVRNLLVGVGWHFEGSKKTSVNGRPVTVFTMFPDSVKYPHITTGSKFEISQYSDNNSLAWLSLTYQDAAGGWANELVEPTKDAIEAALSKVGKQKHPGQISRSLEFDAVKQVLVDNGWEQKSSSFFHTVPHKKKSTFRLKSQNVVAYFVVEHDEKTGKATSVVLSYQFPTAAGGLTPVTEVKYKGQEPLDKWVGDLTVQCQAQKLGGGE